MSTSPDAPFGEPFTAPLPVTANVSAVISGRHSFPGGEAITARLRAERTPLELEVLYIGQAYGKDESRTAIDRLLKHETLQKISLQTTSPNHTLQLLLLEIADNKVMTLFNPFAEEGDPEEQRIANGLDKLMYTTEAERVTLFEASLIKYFQPKYNKEFKGSFPSTNMKVLRDCYDKDFSGLVAEISDDELPFDLFSSVIQPQRSHIAKHDLHTASERRIFFDEK